MGSYNRNSGQVAGLFYHFFLNNGHAFHGNLDAEIASGHHDAVGLTQDGVNVFYRFAPFQFGHYHGFAADSAEILSGVPDVFNGPDKGNGYPVHLQLNAEVKGGFVLFGQHGQVYSYPRQVYALEGGQRPAISH